MDRRLRQRNRANKNGGDLECAAYIRDGLRLGLIYENEVALCALLKHKPSQLALGTQSKPDGIIHKSTFLCNIEPKDIIFSLSKAFSVRYTMIIASSIEVALRFTALRCSDKDDVLVPEIGEAPFFPAIFDRRANLKSISTSFVETGQYGYDLAYQENYSATAWRQYLIGKIGYSIRTKTNVVTKALKNLSAHIPDKDFINFTQYKTVPWMLGAYPK